MGTAALAQLLMEQGTELVDFIAMLNSGDHLIFNAADPIFSGEAGKEPDVRPNGIVSGKDLLSVAVSGTDNMIDVAAFTAYVGGALKTVAAAPDKTLTRPATTKLINSVTMDNAGTVVVIAGTEGAAFVETRGAAGGPPEIPVDSVELGQVRLDAVAAAAIVASEIYQVIGQHAERYDFPAFSIDNIGQGEDAEISAQATAHVKFSSALPLSHTGGLAKQIFIRYHEPIFGEISNSASFTAIETSHSVSSEQVYGGSIASPSESLGQGGFKAMVSDGVKDVLVSAKNRIKTFKFLPNKNKTPFVLSQGKLGIVRDWPTDKQINVTATISGERASADFSG